jgi:CRP-like cAMP-binding protein
MYFIQKGAVRVSQTVRNREKDLAILTKGSFFGELALFTSRPRSATATVAEDCELVEVDAEQLDNFLDEHPELTKLMVKVLAARLRETDDLLENLRLEDSDSRVCNALLQTAEEQGGKYSGKFNSIDLDVDVDQLVVKTTLARDEVRRILIKLKKLGLVEVHEKRVRLPSIDLLKAYRDFLGLRLGVKEETVG